MVKNVVTLAGTLPRLQRVMQHSGYTGRAQPLSQRWLAQHDIFRGNTPEGKQLWMARQRDENPHFRVPYIFTGEHGLRLRSMQGDLRPAATAMTPASLLDMQLRGIVTGASVLLGDRVLCAPIHEGTGDEFRQYAIEQSGVAIVRLYDHVEYLKHLQSAPDDTQLSRWRNLMQAPRRSGECLPLADELFLYERHLPQDLRQAAYEFEVPQLAGWHNYVSVEDGPRLLERWIHLGNRHLIRMIMGKMELDYVRVQVGRYPECGDLNLERCGNAYINATDQLFPGSVRRLEARRDVMATALAVEDWGYARELYAGALALDVLAAQECPPGSQPAAWVRSDVHALAYNMYSATSISELMAQAAARSWQEYQKLPETQRITPSTVMAEAHHVHRVHLGITEALREGFPD